MDLLIWKLVRSQINAIGHLLLVQNHMMCEFSALAVLSTYHENGNWLRLCMNQLRALDQR